MPRHPEDMDPSGTDLEDEEHVDPTQQDNVDGEEVTRKYRRRLAPAELSPRRTGAPRSGVKSRLSQDVPDCRWSDSIAQPDEFAVDAAVTPVRVLTSEPNHQITDNDRRPRTTCGWFRRRRVCPMPGDQLPMPAQQRPRSHDPRPHEFSWQHPRQRGQNEAVLRLQPRTSHLPTQHRHLMAKNEQFNIPRRLTTTARHDESDHHPDGGIQNAEQHASDHAQPSKHRRAEVFEPHRVQAGETGTVHSSGPAADSTTKVRRAPRWSPSTGQRPRCTSFRGSYRAAWKCCANAVNNRSSGQQGSRIGGVTSCRSLATGAVGSQA
jgi:hypothetical protein